MSIRPHGCEARQVSDQMHCERCGLTWDVNDRDEPGCNERVIARIQVDRYRRANTALEAMRKALAPTPLETVQPLVLQELPLKWLPAAGVTPRLVRVDWESYPDAGYVQIACSREALPGPGREYTFFSKTGELMFEVRVWDVNHHRRAAMRRYEQLQPGEWVRL